MSNRFVFNKLNLNQKKDFVFLKGERIAERREIDKYRIELYSYLDFHVEVFYDIKDNAIKKIESVTEEHIIDCYIDMCDLIRSLE